MEQLYDARPITEMYVGYGKYDLPKMTKEELEKELDKTNKEIESIKDEIGDAENYPSFIIKERLINAEDYKDKIMKQLSITKNDNKKVTHESVNDNKRIFTRFKNDLSSYSKK